MRLDPRDVVGGAVMFGALALVALHNSSLGHPGGHDMRVADARGSVTAPVGEPETAFVNFNVVPMDRDVLLRGQTVVVRGRFIARIGDVDEVELSPGARVILGDGSRYLAPGLTDSHVHLRGRYADWLPLFVANGVTTVFNLEGRPGHLALRRRLTAGDQQGPTVYTAGPYVEEPVVRTPADARAAVARQTARGYDFVKVHGALSEDTYRTLLEAGRELDVPVIGHAPRNLDFAVVLEHGQVALTHAEELIQTRLTTLDTAAAGALALEMAEAGTWLIPTLAHFRAVADQWGSPPAVEAVLESEVAAYLPASLREEWRSRNVFLDVDAAGRDRLQEMADFHEPLLRALHRAGVPMLAGTDTPIPTLAPGFSLHSEIEALRDAGFSGYEALATATTNAGRFIRTFVDAGARFGTLEPGSRADLVMLEADPRADVGTLRRPRGVMVRGVWYERAELDAMLDEVAASP